MLPTLALTGRCQPCDDVVASVTATGTAQFLPRAADARGRVWWRVRWRAGRRSCFSNSNPGAQQGHAVETALWSLSCHLRQ